MGISNEAFDCKNRLKIDFIENDSDVHIEIPKYHPEEKEAKKTVSQMFVQRPKVMEKQLSYVCKQHTYIGK